MKIEDCYKVLNMLLCKDFQDTLKPEDAWMLDFVYDSNLRKQLEQHYHNLLEQKYGKTTYGYIKAGHTFCLDFYDMFSEKFELYDVTNRDGNPIKRLDGKVQSNLTELVITVPVDDFMYADFKYRNPENKQEILNGKAAIFYKTEE